MTRHAIKLRCLYFVPQHTSRLLVSLSTLFLSLSICVCLCVCASLSLCVCVCLSLSLYVCVRVYIMCALKDSPPDIPFFSGWSEGYAVVLDIPLRLECTLAIFDDGNLCLLSVTHWTLPNQPGRTNTLQIVLSPVLV